MWTAVPGERIVYISQNGDRRENFKSYGLSQSLQDCRNLRTLSHNSRTPGRDLNLELPQQEAESRFCGRDIRSELNWHAEQEGHCLLCILAVRVAYTEERAGYYGERVIAVTAGRHEENGKKQRKWKCGKKRQGRGTEFRRQILLYAVKTTTATLEVLWIEKYGWGGIISSVGKTQHETGTGELTRFVLLNTAIINRVTCTCQLTPNMQRVDNSVKR
jgi:hypothetical protein